MSAADRQPCCVPFCRRTAPKLSADGDEFDEVICGKHYRLAPAHLRRRLTKVRRIFKRAVAAGDDVRGEKAWRLDHAIWKRIKAAAIEAAMGAR
jgi:hypothetical protein